MTLSHRRLFTWIDVDDQLSDGARSGLWPQWLREASAYWDEVELVTTETTDTRRVASWLTEMLGPGSVESNGDDISICLDSVGDNPSRFLTVTQVVDAERKVSRSPLWRQGSAHAFIGSPLSAPVTDLPVPITAFHSYKGGVGRTTHAMAAALHLSDRNVRVLVIDADIEAPGLSWMYRDAGRHADFAYEDFLALLQSSPAGDFSDAVKLAQLYVPNQAMENILFMPARRDLWSMTPPRVTPADLLTARRSRYHLTESISALARALEVQAVIIDLRAGASEFSSQILLDPRVGRTFVTSASAQSLEGTRAVMREVVTLAPSRTDDHPLPSVVLTQYRESTTIEALSALVEPLIETLAEARRISEAPLPVRLGETDDVVLGETIVPTYSRFREALLQLPRSWQDVAVCVREERLADLMSSIVGESYLSFGSDAPENDYSAQEVDDIPRRRERLSSYAKPLAFAESTETQDFLVTDALQELVLNHRTLLPVAVVSGAKGAGKTFTQLQMIYRKTWSAYAEAAQVSDVSVDARIAPVLTSRNLYPDADARVRELRNEAAGCEVAFSTIDFADAVSEALRAGYSDREWRKLWIWGLAQSVGLKVDPDAAEEAIVEAASRGERWLFVLDGLEDLLQNIATDEAQQQALRVLLSDSLDWIRSIRKQPFGLVVFVRRDLVRAAIRQNSAQFLSRYSNFDLLWDEDEAVRLAAWVATESGALGDQDLDVQKLKGEQLTDFMLPVWGEKLGTPKSREARSRTWFIAALSDFNGGIQARDIVLFLAEAARGSISDERWVDRLLTPVAMRNALLECSKQKINAIGEETPMIREIFNRLRNLDVVNRQVPFSRETVSLESSDLDLLEQNGVLFREGDQYWIPEIFRHGLDFRATGRPRIVSVANLVRKRNNID